MFFIQKVPRAFIEVIGDIHWPHRDVSDNFVEHFGMFLAIFEQTCVCGDPN
jgi:hypothetical protein